MLFEEVKKILIKHKKELQKLGAKAVAVFGSVARNKSRKNSDVDLLVDFDSKKGFFQFVDLKKYLESTLGCEVDIVTRNALHPALKTKILEEVKRVF